MTVSNWVLLGCIVVFLGFYIISSISITNAGKKITVLRHIAGCLILPFAGILNVQFLINYLPDSKHIIYFTLVALFFMTLSQVFFIFREKTWGRKFLQLCLFFVSLIWSQLYRSVLYFVSIPQWLVILFCSFCFVLMLAVFIFSEKKKMVQYISCILIYMQTSILLFFSFVYLCYFLRMQSVMLFFGALLSLLLLSFFYIYDSRKQFKLFIPVCLFLYVVSQSLLMYSNILLCRI